MANGEQERDKAWGRVITVSSHEKGLSNRGVSSLCAPGLARDETDHLVAVSARRDFRVRHNHRLVGQVHGVPSPWLPPPPSRKRVGAKERRECFTLERNRR